MIDVGSAQRRENISTDMLIWQKHQKSVQHDAVHEVCRHRVEDFPVLAFRILYARSSRQVEFANVCLAKKFSAEIIEIFWDTMSHSKFFMAEIEDKQSLKMSISAAFQTTFNRFPCLHAHPALMSTAAKLLLVAKERLSRISFAMLKLLINPGLQLHPQLTQTMPICHFLFLYEQSGLAAR